MTARNEGWTSTAEAVVLGAGISGLVSASVLLEQGGQDVTIVDEYAHIGGNHIDYTYGSCTFDIGSLIFQDDSPLLAHFPEILPRYLPIEPSWSRLNPQGKVTHYPFSIRDDVIAAGPVECARMVLSAAFDRVRKRHPRDAQEFTEHLLGRRFVERSGLGSYMERLCGLPPEQIDLEFAKTRLGWLQGQASARALARRVLGSLRGDPEPPSHNTQLARPREGYAHLYAPAVERLAARGTKFRLGTRLHRVEKEGDRFRVVTDDGAVTARRIISTIPVERALELFGIAAVGEPLPTVTLVSLFFSFRGARGFDTSILYNFSPQGAWKRLTVYSDFYGTADGREYFTVEVIGREVDDSPAAGEADFRAHCAANGLFAGELRLEGHHVLENAYPIYTQGSGRRARAAITALREAGVESLGRQGGFRYQPTARASTVEAEQALRFQ